MSVEIVAALPLGGINLSAAAALGFGLPVLAQFDLSLSLIASLQLDIQLQFEAALQVQIDLALQLLDPLAAFQLALSAIAQLVVSLEASISLGLPTISVDINLSLSASLAITAALGIKLGAIAAVLDLALSVKLPAVNFFAELSAALSAGPVFVLSNFSGADQTLAEAGADIAGLFGAGLDDGGGNIILPTDDVKLLVLVTKEPSASVAMSAMFFTG